MSEQPSPQKRPRTDADDAVSAPDPKTYKQSKIWMNYGDIILQVNDTLFRVNRDVLAKNSLTFRGMFDLPQPSNETQIKGCPIVLLTGDSPKDVELLLGAFYDPFYHRLKLQFDVLAASLRLGRKYEAPAFKQDAARRLHAEFPAILNVWDRRQVRERSNGLEMLRSTPGLYIDLLNLAYENGVYTCVPALALRCLSLYTLSELFAGIERENGSRAMLPDETKLTLARALEAIQLFQWHNLEWLREEGEPVPIEDHEFEQYDKCDYQRQMMCHLNVAPARVDITYLLEPWEKVAGGKWVGALCEDCEKAAKVEHNAGRQRAWDQLPIFFGLPEWKDLKDMD
ncbi:BTB domain-containing protein [Mycena venus]|uniref:BTB domain-containing protein n=1 Tax=Mycena venus TaxID=2733690 RepID=A0A8H7DBE6_9AGAR|nr:BTB domain-containing protein [Mycena venus]